MAIESYGPRADDALVVPHVNDEPTEIDGLIRHSVDTTRDYIRAVCKTPLLDKQEVVELSKKIEIGLFAGRILAVRAAEDPEEMLGELHQQVMYAATERLRGATNTRSKSADEKSGGVARAKAQKRIDELTADELDIARHDADMGVMRIAKYVADESITSQELQLLEAEGSAARRHLAEANLRLVIAIAKRYTARAKTMDYLDLVQEGNKGLMKAVDMFDYAKGYTFATYATNWIHQAIQLSLADHSRTIRLPKEMNNTLHTKIIPERDKLMDELGREPTDTELAAAANLPVAKVQYLRPYVHNPMSIDTKVGAEGDTTLADLIVSDDEPTALDFVHMKELEQAIDSALNGLDDRCAQILRMRYGFGCEPHTPAQVAEVFGVSRALVRKLERRAIDSLAKSSALTE